MESYESHQLSSSFIFFKWGKDQIYLSLIQANYVPSKQMN